jgi:hypothetical protein
MASKDPKMNEQGTPGKMKHVALRISQKLQIIRNLEDDGNQRDVTLSYNTGLRTVCDMNRKTSWNCL